MNFKGFFKLWCQYFYNCTAYYSSFRTNFISTLVVSITFYVATILSVYYLFDHVSFIGGYNKDTFLFFVAYASLTFSVDSVLFSANYWHLPMFIRTGELDFLLTKPFPSLFVIFSNFIMIPELIALPFLTAFLLFMGFQNDLTFLQWCLLPFSLILSVYSCVLLQMLISLACFWTIEGRGVNLMRMNFISVGRYPEFIYHIWLRSILFYLPSLLIISPYFYFLKDPHRWPLLVYVLGFVVFLGFVVKYVFLRGLRRYESASS